MRLGRPALFLEDVAFREDRQAAFGQPEAAIDLADGDEERGGVRIFGAERRRRDDLILLGELEQPLGAARRRRHENGDLAGVTAVANRCEEVLQAALELGDRLAAHVVRCGAPVVRRPEL